MSKKLECYGRWAGYKNSFPLYKLSNDATTEDERDTKCVVPLANRLTVNKLYQVLKADLSAEICFNHSIHL